MVKLLHIMAYIELEKPSFIANLFLSNVLAILGNLSRTFQLAQLNLLTVDQLVTDAVAALNSIKNNPANTGYMMELEATMKSINAKEPFATSYLDAIIINNLKNRFPQIRIITLLGYFQPQNIHSSTP